MATELPLIEHKETATGGDFRFGRDATMGAYHASP